MAEKRLPIVRWVAEFVLIVGSVYLAVFLEGQSQEREDRAQARTVLSQLLGELKEDLADFDRIIVHQNGLDRHYSDMRRWLSHPVDLPLDSVRTALIQISTENSTLFPRQASWTSLISGGKLASLESPALALSLGQLYETAYDRVEYNGNKYDEALNLAYLSAPGILWHTFETQPLSGDARELQELASRLEWMHLTWTVWYIDLLVGYREQVRLTIGDVEAYLDDRAR